MRSITFEKLLNGVASTAGIDPANLLAHEKINLTEYINDAIRFCWDYYPWAEFTVVEKRYFRDEWISTNVYSQDDEVYYNGKYYKVWANLAGHPTGAPDSDPSTWHEIGDLTQNPAWSEKSLYELGAIVKYENENYLCIQVPAGGTSSGMQQTNFEYDAITPENTLYFKKLDERFERYIGYEQTGRNAIETVISVHRTDPRYTKSMPLNFREDVEGIYIQAEDEAVNEVWVRFRIDSPIYETTSLTAEVPKFMVPALKAHAYKSWLQGDGQHEKAELQEIKVLDLLVREVDKLDQQQDRGKPYVIRKNPYRRFNSTQAYTTGVTEDQINQIHDGFADTSLTFNLNSTGRNSVVRGTTSCTTKIDCDSTGGNKAVIAGEFVRGGDPVIGKYIIFLQGYNHPVGTGSFPPDTYFQIEYIAYNSTTGEIEQIEYYANFTDSTGTYQKVYQGIDATNYLNQKGTFWDVLYFDIVNLNSRIDLDVVGKNAIVESSVSQVNLVLFTGSPFRGQDIGEVEGLSRVSKIGSADPIYMTMSSTALGEKSIERTTSIIFGIIFGSVSHNIEANGIASSALSVSVSPVNFVRGQTKSVSPTSALTLTVQPVNGIVPKIGNANLSMFISATVNNASAGQEISETVISQGISITVVDLIIPAPITVPTSYYISTNSIKEGNSSIYHADGDILKQHTIVGTPNAVTDLSSGDYVYSFRHGQTSYSDISLVTPYQSTYPHMMPLSATELPTGTYELKIRAYSPSWLGVSGTLDADAGTGGYRFRLAFSKKAITTNSNPVSQLGGASITAQYISYQGFDRTSTNPVVNATHVAGGVSSSGYFFPISRPTNANVSIELGQANGQTEWNDLQSQHFAYTANDLMLGMVYENVYHLTWATPVMPFMYNTGYNVAFSLDQWSLTKIS